MNKRLTNIDPMQCGKVLGALYGLLSLIVVPFLLVGALLVPRGGSDQMPVAGLLFLIILIPVFYGIIGLVGGIIAAAVYNLVAKMTGGLQFTFVDVGPDSPPLVGYPQANYPQ